MKVEVIDCKTGQTKSMHPRFAKVLVGLKRATYAQENTYQTRAMTAEPAPLVSDHVRDYAAEVGIDLAAVTGTGTNGRITKKDVEALIQPRD